MLDRLAEYGRAALHFLARHWDQGLEILVIAAVIYAVLLTLRGTRGAGLLRGVGILAAFAVVFSGVRYLGLVRISWLLERVLAVSAIALVVVFQPELRRMLVRLGQTRFLGWLGKPRSMALDELLAAVAAMSKRRTGLLVAIQREESLAPILEGGTRLEAEVSSELLGSIFFPNSPLHDGGAVIRSNRIAAAGCLFPLSENQKLPRELGTRHRAAVGITEETDAVAVVVSEETGRISVAVRGDLMYDLTLEELKSVLHNLCYEAMESALPGGG